MTDVILTAEAARMIGVVPATVRWLEKTGRLKAERTSGGTRLYRRIDVIALRQEREARRAAVAAPVPVNEERAPA